MEFIVVVWVIIGILIVGFIYVMISPFLPKNAAKVTVPFQRRRPLLIDERFGIAEIQGREDYGQDKFALELSNGLRPLYFENEIMPVNQKQVIADKERPVFIYKPKNGKETGRVLLGGIEPRERKLQAELLLEKGRKREDYNRRFSELAEVVKRQQREPRRKEEYN